jgi:hypothetical protein
VLRIRIRTPDPGTGAFLTPGYGIRDQGSEMGKNQDPDPKSGSGMNNPAQVSESLETIFLVKFSNSLMRIRDPGIKKFGSGNRDGNNSDPG